METWGSAAVSRLIVLCVLTQLSRGIAAGKTTGNQRKEQSHDEISHRDRDRQERKSSTTGHSDSGDKPDSRRSREAGYAVSPYKDQSCPNETDPRHDLRRHAGRIEHNSVIDQNVGKPVFRDQQEKSSCCTYDRIGAEPCAFVANLALQADQGGEDKRKAELQKLVYTLRVEDFRPPRRLIAISRKRVVTRVLQSKSVVMRHLWSVPRGWPHALQSRPASRGSPSGLGPYCRSGNDSGLTRLQ